MLRCLFGALYVDMRCFGVSWGLSKHEIPHPNQWGSMITTKNTSITECFAATSTFTLCRFGKFFKIQLWDNVHNAISSTERSDILVFNCYLFHVSYLLTCYVCSTMIGVISNISKCFENFVSQALGVDTRTYAAELRLYIKSLPLQPIYINLKLK